MRRVRDDRHDAAAGQQRAPDLQRRASNETGAWRQPSLRPQGPRTRRLITQTRDAAVRDRHPLGSPSSPRCTSRRPGSRPVHLDRTGSDSGSAAIPSPSARPAAPSRRRSSGRQRRGQRSSVTSRRAPESASMQASRSARIAPGRAARRRRPPSAIASRPTISSGERSASTPTSYLRPGSQPAQAVRQAVGRGGRAPR